MNVRVQETFQKSVCTTFAISMHLLASSKGASPCPLSPLGPLSLGPHWSPASKVSTHAKQKKLSRDTQQAPDTEAGLDTKQPSESKQVREIEHA